jgi:hypothetical protein
MKSALCEIGFHKWGEWHETTGHIDIDGDYTYTVMQQECKRCGLRRYDSLTLRFAHGEHVIKNPTEWWR